MTPIKAAAEPTLLPCPFCGSPAAMSVLLDDDNEPGGDIISAWVACPCGVELHESRTEAEAAMRWNARAAPPEASFDNASDMLGYLNAPQEAEPDDWRDDPSADERWNAGVDLVMKLLCDYLGVGLSEVTWDAATETVDGDISAVIGNILRTKYGENWSPASPSPIPEAPGGIPNYEFPYQQTFDAIAAATEIYPSKEQALGFSISVRKFQEAFNNHRDHRALKPQDGGESGR